LYPRNKQARGVIVFCMLGSITAIVTTLAISLRSRSASLTVSISNLTYYVPLLFTNVVATLLVGAKFWEFRTQIIAHLYPSGQPGERRTSPVNRVLVLLTESGMIYCLYWILSMISSVAIMGAFAAEIFECVLPQLSCIYLSTVILVSLQKSFNMNSILSEQPDSALVFEKPSSDSGVSIDMPRIGVSFVDRVKGVSSWDSVAPESPDVDTDDTYSVKTCEAV